MGLNREGNRYGLGGICLEYIGVWFLLCDGGERDK